MILPLAAIVLSLAAAPALAGPTEDHGVVPDVIDKAPEAVIKVDYSSGKSVDFGNELTPTQVKDLPTISWPAEKDAYYTLAMVDPDAPSRADPKSREFMHYMVNNIPGDDISKGFVRFGYVGAGPPKGTGLHRYVFLAYKQSGQLDIKDKPVPNTSTEGRRKFSIRNFAKENGLGEPVAVNFFQAQYDDWVPVQHAQFKN